MLPTGTSSNLDASNWLQVQTWILLTVYKFVCFQLKNTYCLSSFQLTIYYRQPCQCVGVIGSKCCKCKREPYVWMMVWPVRKRRLILFYRRTHKSLCENQQPTDPHLTDDGQSIRQHAHPTCESDVANVERNSFNTRVACKWNGKRWGYKLKCESQLPGWEKKANGRCFINKYEKLKANKGYSIDTP